MRWRIRFPTLEQWTLIYFAQIGVCGVVGCLGGATLGYKESTLQHDPYTEKVMASSSCAVAAGIAGVIVGLGTPVFVPIGLCVFAADQLTPFFAAKKTIAEQSKESTTKE